jgi:hypothetical protein
VLVRVRIALLADCGWSASACCRHVDKTTVVHCGRRPSTPCPLPLPAPSPGSAQVRDAATTPIRPPVGRSLHRCWSAVGSEPVGCGAVRVEKAHRSPDVTWHTRDLPNLCTFLGTTSRRVDGGHRLIALRHRDRSALSVCRLVHTSVDSDRRAGPEGSPKREGPGAGAGGVRPTSGAKEAAVWTGSCRAGPEGSPRSEGPHGSAQQGDGSWRRCGPEDRNVIAGRGS